MGNNSIKIAIVVSQFNQFVTARLLESTKEKLLNLGVEQNQIEIAWVPGAVELPLIAQQYAKTKRFDAIIWVGVVNHGETDHYDYVCQQVSYGCQRVALHHDLPVIFGFLTTDNREQALARAGGLHSNKGHEWAQAAIDMVNCVRRINFFEQSSENRVAENNA